MTKLRRLLLIIDETDAYVPRSVRNAVEAHERGEPSREGDPIKLLEARIRTRPDILARFHAVASTTPMGCA